MQKIDKTVLRPYQYFKDKYSVTKDEMRYARKNGLPARQISGHWYYRECDFNDYYAGKIGGRDEDREQEH